MERKRAILGIGAALATVVMTCSSGAHVHIALEDKNDPAPRRVEAGIQLASLCLSFILSWSQDQSKPAVRALR